MILLDAAQLMIVGYSAYCVILFVVACFENPRS